jgi:hypothetical protein
MDLLANYNRDSDPLLVGGDSLWGIVDNGGRVMTSSGRVQIFKTRKEARIRNKRVNGSVRKLFIQFEKRDAGGA